MAVRVSTNSNTNKLSYISVPSQIINSLSSSALQTLLLSPKKAKNVKFSFRSYKNPRFWFISLFLFSLFGMLKLVFNVEPLIPFAPYPCVTSQSRNMVSNGFPQSQMKKFVRSENEYSKLLISNEGFKSQVDVAPNNEENDSYSTSGVVANSNSLTSDFDSKADMGVSLNNEKSDFDSQSEVGSEADEQESEFWKQPEGLGYKPCLDFSEEYKKATKEILKDRRKYLLVVVSGGMNQQRNQIVDAVVIARILGAALVVPVLQVNLIWGDESEFSDIFDLDHFKEVLADDVRVISSLPSTHIRTRPVEEKRTPLHASPEWIRSHYLKRLTREGVLLLRGLDSRLSKDLPSDLQKLRCKVAFHALRFAPRILEIGNKLAERMRSKGPYLALHLRMEKDVWVRTGCLPGLSHEYDEMIYNERKQRPELLTARSNMNYHKRKLAGLCPLNAVEVTRLLKALGAPENARIYWAGGQPLGGKEALLPLTREFPYFYNKEDLALPGELESFVDKASFMAAIDYIVCEKSDVFMPSHGGNMAHAIQGHRAYAGHKKFITPNKRHMLPYFLNSSLPSTELNRIIKDLHRDSLGQPDLRDKRSGRDVTKYPVPECMRKDSQTGSF